MRLSRKKGGAARPKRTVKSRRFWPFSRKRTMKSRVAQGRELMRIEAEIEELLRQATLLEERAYMIRKAEREAQGNSLESNNNFYNEEDPNNTDREMNDLIRNLSRSGIAKVRH